MRSWSTCTVLKSRRSGQPYLDRIEDRIPADATWAFVIRPIDATHTRLIQRFRFGAGPRLLGKILYTALIEIPHFVMERKMLLGIRARAEQAYAESATLAAAA